MNIDIPFHVTGARDEVEAREVIVNTLIDVGLFHMNKFLAAEGKKIHIAVVTPK